MPGYFHELSDYEFQCLIEERITYEEVQKRHPQPSWCKYPDAIGRLGCWSLMDRDRIINRDYCKRCECYEKS